jgi:hypothetical protein
MVGGVVNSTLTMSHRTMGWLAWATPPVINSDSDTNAICEKLRLPIFIAIPLLAEVGEPRQTANTRSERGGQGWRVSKCFTSTALRLARAPIPASTVISTVVGRDWCTAAFTAF